MEALTKCEKELSTLWFNDESRMWKRRTASFPREYGLFVYGCIPFENVTLPSCFLLFMGWFKVG